MQQQIYIQYLSNRALAFDSSSIAMNNWSNHEKALDSLCFVCGSLVSKAGGFHLVQDLMDFLSRTLRYPELFEIAGITPKKLCSLCYGALSHVDRGETIKTGKVMVEWNECGPDCTACKMFLATQRQQRQHVGRKKKVRVFIIIVIIVVIETLEIMALVTYTFFIGIRGYISAPALRAFLDPPEGSYEILAVS